MCHDPDSVTRERLDPVLAPKLAGVTERVQRDWLVEFLADPRAVRPSSTHPHQLGLVAESARSRIAESIADFLTDGDAGAEGAGDPEGADSETSDIGEVERGRALFHTVGCVACHGPQEHELDLELSLVELAELEPYDPDEEEDDGTVEDLPPVQPGVFALEPHALPTDLVRKYRLSTLAAFLADPVAVRPSGHCPSMDLSTTESRAIAAYLLLEQAQRPDGSYDREPGLLLNAYEGKYGGNGLEQLETQEPVATSVVRTIDVEGRTRDDHFGLRFSGLLDVAEPGSYTFHLRSDDGSRLWIGDDRRRRPRRPARPEHAHGQDRPRGRNGSDPGDVLRGRGRSGAVAGVGGPRRRARAAAAGVALAPRAPLRGAEGRRRCRRRRARRGFRRARAAGVRAARLRDVPHRRARRARRGLRASRADAAAALGRAPQRARLPRHERPLRLRAGGGGRPPRALPGSRFHRRRRELAGGARQASSPRTALLLVPPARGAGRRPPRRRRVLHGRRGRRARRPGALPPDADGGRAQVPTRRAPRGSAGRGARPPVPRHADAEDGRGGRPWPRVPPGVGGSCRDLRGNRGSVQRPGDRRRQATRG